MNPVTECKPRFWIAASMLCAALLATGAPAPAASPWDPDEVRLVSKKLTDGVYAVLPDDADERDHTATTAGFIVGERSVFLVETMLNEDLFSQLEDLVREVTEKPIRWVVNTSHHGDHSYGNYLLPEDAVVIQHPYSKRFVDANFKSDKAFMLDIMGSGKGLEAVQPRSADIAISEFALVDLGNRIVEIHHFGFGQTAGDLVVWLPDVQVMWTGNLVQGPAPTLPWLLHGGHREAINTLEKVMRFLPADSIIVPGHGRLIGRDDIAFSVRYLRELDAAISKAIEQGLNLDAAREAARLSEYQAYSLYDWIHLQVNVPAVYEAVSQSR